MEKSYIKRGHINELYWAMSKYKHLLKKDLPLEYILSEVKKVEKEGIYYHGRCCKYFVS